MYPCMYIQYTHIYIYTYSYTDVHICINIFVYTHTYVHLQVFPTPCNRGLGSPLARAMGECCGRWANVGSPSPFPRQSAGSAILAPFNGDTDTDVDIDVEMDVDID